jgi:hypothetical protein
LKAREILRTGEGKWIDLVRWRSMAEARVAAQKVIIERALPFAHTAPG